MSHNIDILNHGRGGNYKSMHAICLCTAIHS